MFVGRTHGRIVPARGDNQFGWDPVFEPEGFGETYAEMAAKVKNTISHRCGRLARRSGARLDAERPALETLTIPTLGPTT